jgi:tripartite-type tricarboxylate transporter receptor subunit TctC
MKIQRRQFLHLAAGAAALPAVSRIARAQSYPMRPVRIVVGFAPGGGTDIMARLIGQWLSERVGQQFLIENRPGAGTTIATESVVRSPADGYTLLMVGAPAAINATLYGKLNYNFIRDIALIGSISREPQAMVVNPSFRANTVPEFIAYAKARPGEITMASAGNGSEGHVAGELFKMMTGINMVHVPYRGAGPAITDLIGGQVQVLFNPTAPLIQYIKAGNLTALAVTTTARSEALPNIPTVADFVPGFESSAFYGLGAPKNTPVEIIDRLNREINAVLATPNMKARIAELGGTVFPTSAADLGRFMAAETEKYAKVVKFAGIKAD